MASGTLVNVDHFGASTIYDTKTTPRKVFSILKNKFENAEPLHCEAVPRASSHYASAFVHFPQGKDGSSAHLGWTVENDKKIRELIEQAKRDYPGGGPKATEEILSEHMHDGKYCTNCVSGTHGPTVGCIMKLKSGIQIFQSAYAVDVDIYEDGPDALSYMVWRNAQLRHRDFVPRLFKGTWDLLFLSNNGSTDFPNLLVEMRPHRPDLTCVVCQTRPDIWVQVKQCAKCRSVNYCSSDCQRMHWKAEHKRCCASMAAARVEKEANTVRKNGQGEAAVAHEP